MSVKTKHCLKADKNQCLGEGFADKEFLRDPEDRRISVVSYIEHP